MRVSTTFTHQKERYTILLESSYPHSRGILFSYEGEVHSVDTYVFNIKVTILLNRGPDIYIHRSDFEKRITSVIPIDFTDTISFSYLNLTCINIDALPEKG